MDTRSRGFSLIELLIVIAIILTLAAMAVRFLLESRIVANESSAVRSVRTIATAQHMYQDRFQNIGYATTLVQLGPGSPSNSSHADYIDESLAGGEKSGYVFELTGSTDSFFIIAKPKEQDKTGKRTFCTSPDGVIRADIGKCDASSVPIPK